MKKFCLLVLAVASVLTHSQAQTVDFNDIQFWVGSGANEAALEIDWNDGKSPEALVWGFRWDGTATGADMFNAVVNADPRLFAHLGTFDFGSGPEPGVLGIGYDLNGNGNFGVTSSPSLNFDSNGLAVDSLATGDANVDASGTPTDPADHWLESWYPAPGYWAYYTKSSTAGSWDFASTGSAGRILTDGAWDGWSFAPDYSSGTEPSVPSIAPVPEPTTVALCFVSSAFLLFRRFRITRAA